MKTRRIFKYGVWILAALALAAITPLVWFFTAGMRTPVRAPAPDYWPTDGWRTSTPEEQGFDSAKLAQGLRSLQERQQNINSLLIIRNGYVVLDAYFAPYDGTFPHDLASVTKSVTTTLIAIAADQGYLDLDRPVVSYFPGRTIANLDERKARLTVRHLAEMRNGMESGCQDGDEPTLDAMQSSHPDWVQAALDRPMVAEPGTEILLRQPGDAPAFGHPAASHRHDRARLRPPKPLRTAGHPQCDLGNVIRRVTRAAGATCTCCRRMRPRSDTCGSTAASWDGRQIVPEAWVLDCVPGAQQVRRRAILATVTAGGSLRSGLLCFGQRRPDNSSGRLPQYDRGHHRWGIRLCRVRTTG